MVRIKESNCNYGNDDWSQDYFLSMYREPDHDKCFRANENVAGKMRSRREEVEEVEVAINSKTKSTLVHIRIPNRSMI